MSDLILPAVAGQLSAEMLEQFILKSDLDTKIKLDMNYLQLLRQRHADVPSAQFLDFLYKCKLYSADPRMQQVFLVSYKTKKNKNINGRWEEVWETVANTVFAYQFFMDRAESTGQRMGHEVQTVEGEYFNPFTRERFPDLICTAKVYRKDRNVVSYTARLREFVSMDKNGNPRGQWLEKPYLMLEKCALANGYRWAFPEWMTGMYTQEEMPPEQLTIDAEVMPKRGPGRPPKEPEDLATKIEQFVPESKLPAVVSLLQKEEKPALVVKPEPEKAPVAAPVVEATPEAPKPPVEAPKPSKPPSKPPTRDPHKTPVSILSKGRLWSLVKAAGDAGKLNVDFVQQKLTAMGSDLTEGLCNTMCQDLVAGNLNWFRPVEAAKPALDDNPEEVPF